MTVIDAETVKARIEEAASVIRTWPGDGPAKYKSAWPDVSHDDRDAWLAAGAGGDPGGRYRKETTRITHAEAAHERAWEAVMWTYGLPTNLRVALWACALRRGAVKKAARKMGCNRRTVTRWRDMAVDAITRMA
jgi:hypothetical protein